jgi:hypothetical protein
VTTIEREALIGSLTGLVGRTRAFLHELEAYAGEIGPAASLEPRAVELMGALAAVIGDRSQAGVLRELETAATAVLRSLVYEGAQGPTTETGGLPNAGAAERPALPRGRQC